jgi:hypothetical protein
LATVFLSWIDGLMGWLPSPLRLVVWALLAAAVSMALYRLTSPQTALQQIRQRRIEVQQRLNAYDGPMAEAMPLLGASLRLALVQLLRVLWPTAVAALPLVVLILWLDMTYGYQFPAPGSEVAVRTYPPAAQARLQNFHDDGADQGDQWVVIVEESTRPEQDIAIPAPVPAIAKHHWWNVLIGNPAGYLPAESAVDLITLDLPYREHLSIGPGWLRTWHVAFFAAMFAASLAIKLRFRIL